VTPDPNDALLEQLTQAGLYPQQLAQLQRQYQLAQGFMQPQEAQGRQVGGTYVAASPWEHLANAIRPVVGALMQRSAMNREGELTSQLSSGRQAFARALQDKMGKPGELMPGGAGDQQGLQQLSMMGELSGDPAMQHAAQAYQQQSVLQNSMRHQQIGERQEQEKIDQGRYTPIKDMYGNVTGLLEGKTGKVLPMSVRGASQGGLTPQALQMLTQQGLATGQVPQIGKGNAGTATAMQIANSMAANGGATPDLAGARAGNHADSASLASQQKILDNAESWERTGKANLNVLLGIAQDLHDTGSPWLNRPVRLFAEKAVGQPGQTAFRAAHATVVNEYAKILSGAQGSGAVTEGARHEAESMLPLDATWEQLAAAAKVLDTDAGNRIGAARQQVDQIRGRISGKQQAGSVPPTAPPPAGPGPSAPSGRPRRTVNGETREWDGSKWVPING
jgi:hypothetical protein